MSSPARHIDPFDSFDDADDSFTQNYEAADPLDLGDPFDDLPDADLQPLTPEPVLPRQALTAASFTAVEPTDDLGAVSIPRIGIHFFPQNDATLQACDTAALDRRMVRAQSLVRRGGIEEAIAVYQHEPTPSLLIVESNEASHGLLDQLGRLAEVCDTNTKVVVIGAHNDISLYRELIRQGVSEYMVAPVKPLQLIKSIATLFNDPETPFVGRAIAFIGARGGAGSSVLAHNFAHSLSEAMQANTVIADYDLPFGTAGLDFNQDPLQGMADALNEPDRLDQVLLDRMLTRCTERLSLFSAPASLDQDYLADEHAFEEVTRKVRSVAPFIVMDLPHIWTPWLKKCLIAADEVVIVTTPDLASLRNAKNLIELLKSFRPNDNPPRIVLNQVDMPGRPEIPVKDFTAALGVAPVCTISFDAKTFGQAANNGQMIAECAPASKAHEALLALTATITGRTPETKKKAASTSLIGKFFPKKK